MNKKSLRHSIALLLGTFFVPLIGNAQSSKAFYEGIWKLRAIRCVDESNVIWAERSAGECHPNSLTCNVDRTLELRNGKFEDSTIEGNCILSAVGTYTKIGDAQLRLNKVAGNVCGRISNYRGEDEKVFTYSLDRPGCIIETPEDSPCELGTKRLKKQFVYCSDEMG